MTPAVCNDDGGGHRPRDMVTQKNQAKQSNLHRLGLGIGDADHKAAGMHGGQHQRCRSNLRDRAERRPGDGSDARQWRGIAIDRNGTREEKGRQTAGRR